MTYTMSEARKKSDLKQANWENRMQIFMLRNQGWTFTKIAEYMSEKKRITRQAVSQSWNKIKDMDIREIQKLVR